MINADTLAGPQLDAVVRQLISQVSQVYQFDPSLARAKVVELGQTFSRWTLRRPLDAAPRPASQLFHKIGYWHQVTFDGVPGAFAHSQEGLDGSGAPTICAVGVSPHVTKIDQAAKWLDTAAADGVVRLLDLPTHYLLCFWIAGARDSFVVIDALDPVLLGLLPRNQIHSLSTLVSALVEFRRRVPAMTV